ncbi:MAG: hypothetical protein WCV56_01090 [Candidatus Omnitrophota bacterium]
MSQENLGLKAFVAGEDLEAYRRVKLSAGSGTQVEYADAGEDFIGVTAAKTLQNDFVTVALKSAGRTFKLSAGEAFAVGATLYGANDGKVADTAVGSAIGTALEAASADGEIIEGVFNNGVASYIDGASVAVVPENDNGAIPVVFAKTGITDATTAVAIVESMPFKCKIVDWQLISRDTTAANIKLQDGETTPNDITANKAKGTADDTIVPGGTIIAETDELEAGSALKVLASAEASFDVFVTVIKIS